MTISEIETRQKALEAEFNAEKARGDNLRSQVEQTENNLKLIQGKYQMLEELKTEATQAPAPEAKPAKEVAGAASSK